MSVKVSSWVWHNSRARGPELLVLLAIADSAEDDGTNARPRVQTLAAKTRIGQRSVVRHIDSLRSLGELEVTRTGRANRYSVLMIEAEQKRARLAYRAEKSSQDRRIRDATCGVSETPPVAFPIETSIETSTETSSLSAPLAAPKSASDLPPSSLQATEHALAAACDIALDDLTRSEAKKLRQAAKHLDGRDAAEIQARADEARRRWSSKASITPKAIADNWSALAPRGRVDQADTEIVSGRLTEVPA